jgi:hypothetical protein
MGYYEERPPRHGHRSPTELADDEMLSSIHGDFCGMPEAVDATVLAADAERACLTHFALLPCDDAHPLVSTLVKLRANEDGAQLQPNALRGRKSPGRTASDDNADT